MAITASGIYTANMIDVFDATQLAIDLSLTSHKLSLISNSATPNFAGNGDASWNSTNEVSGTGWASGGVALSAAAAGATSTAPTLTDVGNVGTMVYDMNDVSVASTTLTNARGVRMYADALAGDNLIFLVNFGADYSTSNGTFAITWHANGVFSVDWTP